MQHRPRVHNNFPDLRGSDSGIRRSNVKQEAQQMRR